MGLGLVVENSIRGRKRKVNVLWATLGTLWLLNAMITLTVGPGGFIMLWGELLMAALAFFCSVVILDDDDDELAETEYETDAHKAYLNGEVNEEEFEQMLDEELDNETPEETELIIEMEK